MLNPIHPQVNFRIPQKQTKINQLAVFPVEEEDDQKFLLESEKLMNQGVEYAERGK